MRCITLLALFLASASAFSHAGLRTPVRSLNLPLSLQKCPVEFAALSKANLATSTTALQLSGSATAEKKGLAQVYIYSFFFFFDD